MNEYWDAYDQDMRLIPGVRLVRGEPIPEGMCHIVCDVIVQHDDGSYLIMQRDPRKHYGSMWEATAGGSALQGESPMECAVRELEEETGIHCSALMYVGKVVDSETIYIEFFCKTDCPKDSIVLQDGETTAYRWVSREELLSMRDDELLTQRMQTFVEDLRS